MKIKLELMGALVDYLPSENKGKSEIEIKDKSTIEDLLKYLQIKRRVVVSVNEDEEKDSDYILSDEDEVLIFTVMSGG